MSILSVLDPAAFKKAVVTGDVKAVSSANGIGKKTAERVILDLRDKVSKLTGIKAAELPLRQAPILGERAKAVSMLVATGANKAEAERAVASIEDDSLKASQYFMQAAKMFK